MPRKKIYGMEPSLAAAAMALGIGALGLAAGLWYSKGRELETTADLLCMIAVEGILVATGIVLVGLRMRTAVDAGSRRVEFQRAFLGVPFARRSWDFGELSEVRFDLASYGRSAPALRLLLVPRSGAEGIVVRAYVALDHVPPEALADARELAELTGLPFTQRDIPAPG